MATFIRKLKVEVMNILPAIIYFLIAFNLIFFTTGLMLPPGTPRYFSYLTVSIGALIVGKVILITNYFSFMNAFPDKPLIYNIIWKFFMYTLAVFLFKLIESIIRLSYHYKSTYLACSNICYDLTTPLFWSSFIGLSLVFIVFVVFSEFTRVLGKERIKKILFG